MRGVIRQTMTEIRGGETLIEVWRQSARRKKRKGSVKVGGEKVYPVCRTPKRGLRQVDFMFRWGKKFEGT